MIEITWLYNEYNDNINDGPKHVILKYNVFSIYDADYNFFETLKNLLNSKYTRISELNIYTVQQQQNVLYIENQIIKTIYNCPLNKGISLNDIQFFLQYYRNFLYVQNINNFYEISGKEHPLYNPKMLNTKMMNELMIHVNESIRLFFLQRNMI